MIMTVHSLQWMCSAVQDTSLHKYHACCHGEILLFLIFNLNKTNDIRPSKRNKVFLVRTFSKFGEGGSYHSLFFQN